MEEDALSVAKILEPEKKIYTVFYTFKRKVWVDFVQKDPGKIHRQRPKLFAGRGIGKIT